MKISFQRLSKDFRTCALKKRDLLFSAKKVGRFFGRCELGLCAARVAYSFQKNDARQLLNSDQRAALALPR